MQYLTLLCFRGQGTVMHVTAKNNIAYCFIDKLKEGCLYSLRDFIVQPNKDEYRILKDSPYLIQLQGSTIVAKATDDLDGYVRYPFQLVPFEELLPTENKYFVGEYDFFKIHIYLFVRFVLLKYAKHVLSICFYLFADPVILLLLLFRY